MITIAPGCTALSTRWAITSAPGRDQSAGSTSHWMVSSPSDRAIATTAGGAMPYGGRSRQGRKPVAVRIACWVGWIWPATLAAVSTGCDQV